MSIALPTSKQYRVIYADPPWAWSKTALLNRGRARAVEKEYPTVQPEELERLPVFLIGLPDSALFLWTTGPKLPIALRVMRAWQYEYKTVAFVWVKRNRKSDGYFTGMGFYTRANAELVLVGARGSPKRLDAGVSQIVDAAVSEHSAKPAEVRDRITRLYDGPRIELFARERVNGWDAWGLEVDGRLALDREETR